MSRPSIVVTDDDPLVAEAITRDLRQRFGAEHRVVRATSGAEALDVLARLALRDEPVALLVTDQRMPQMTGTEMLSRAREHAPDARMLLLTAYADTDAAITAINDIGLDYYLLKPWDPPEERLYPVVEDLLDGWHRDHPEHASVVRVVGHRWSDRSHDVKTFLARNHVPYLWFDVEEPDGERLAGLAGATLTDLPLVLVPDAKPLLAPTMLQVAEGLGLRTTAEQPLYDVAIVGGGPAGLAAAVYAASEGLRTIVLEREAPGGQAGQSAAIENYLGFPRGLSGSDLAQRAIAQVSRFGAEMLLAREVVGFESRGPVRAVLLDGGAEVEARSVVVATGVSYRRLVADGVDDLTGRGIYYGASASDAAQVDDQVVHVVGAANSAGQAVLNFARHASKVVMLVRGPSLEASMSRYLIERIDATPNIEIRCGSEVAAATGDGHLESLTLRDRGSGEQETVDAGWLFVFIGASPHTGWLGGDVARNEHGFVVTGPAVATGARLAARARAVRAGVERARRVRRRRRTPGLHEAGRLGRRRGGDGRAPGPPLPGDHLMEVEDVRGIPLLDGLTDEQLAELVAGGDEWPVEPGVVLFHEGELAEYWWVLIDGAVELSRRIGREDTVVGMMDVPGRWAGGLRAWDQHGAYLATGRGARPGRMLRVPAEVLRAQMQAWFPLAVHLIGGLYGTARSIESTARQRDSLVTLGTLAAGLAHELNNPVAAAGRSVDALETTCDTLLSSLGGLAAAGLEARQFAALDELRLSADPRSAYDDPLAAADAEDELAAWLRRQGVTDPWQLASELSASGADLAWCEQVAGVVPPAALAPALTWVASALSARRLLGEVREATARVSGLVSSVRSYTQLDRASLQPVDVTEGLESTLVMLGHKLRDAGVTVVREYAAALPRVEGYAGELNQVWTNLLDNAVDAMAGGGTLTIGVHPHEGSLVVEVGDTGHGMPPEVVARAFDAFYTTKDVGKGTGLGLDIARRVVVERHGGEVTIDSSAAGTTMRVRLPLTGAGG